MSAHHPAEATGGKAGFCEEALPCLPAVYRFALRLTRGNESEAEDLTQDTFLRAYRRWETYTPGTLCLSWLFTICRNAAVRRAEGKARRMEHLATDLGVDDVATLAPLPGIDDDRAVDPEVEYFDSIVDAEVRQAVDRLPREYRDAVVLCDLHGMGYGEIAEVLGVAAGTVKSRIHRGRRILHGTLYAYASENGYVKAVSAGG